MMMPYARLRGASQSGGRAAWLYSGEKPFALGGINVSKAEEFRPIRKRLAYAKALKTEIFETTSSTVAPTLSHSPPLLALSSLYC